MKKIVLMILASVVGASVGDYLYSPYFSGYHVVKVNGVPLGERMIVTGIEYGLDSYRDGITPVIGIGITGTPIPNELYPGVFAKLGWGYSGVNSATFVGAKVFNYYFTYKDRSGMEVFLYSQHRIGNYWVGVSGSIKAIGTRNGQGAVFPDFGVQISRSISDQ